MDLSKHGAAVFPSLPLSTDTRTHNSCACREKQLRKSVITYHTNSKKMRLQEKVSNRRTYWCIVNIELPPLAATSRTTMPALGCTLDVFPDHRSLTEMDLSVYTARGRGVEEGGLLGSGLWVMISGCCPFQFREGIWATPCE